MIKKIICMVAVFMLTVTMIPSKAFASETSEQTGVSEGVLSYVSNVEFIYETDGDNVIITGYKGELPSELIIPETIEGKVVTEIGERAFFRAEGITSVTIPVTVKKIDDRAFGECPDLVSATIGAAEICDYAFYKTSGWEELNFLEGVTSIGKANFSDWKMRTIELPRSLQHIGSQNIRNYNVVGCYKDSYVHWAAVENNWQFYLIDGTDAENMVTGEISETFSWTLNKKSGELKVYCDGEMPAYTENTRNYWSGYDDFIVSVIISDQCTSIGEDAFKKMDQLKNVIVGSSVEHIDENAFYLCELLQNVVLPEGIKSIAPNAFRSCINLETINFPEGMESIGKEAFYYCESLQSVEIPSTIKRIESSTFAGCESIKEAKLNEGLEEIGDYAFSGCIAMEKADIPKSVKTIGICAFQTCSSLTEIDLSGNIQDIQVGAFGECESITTAVVPDCMTTIPRGLFRGCSGLKEVYIPDTVTEIGAYAFSECTSLAAIDLPSSLTKIDEEAFLDCDSITMVAVPDGVTQMRYRVFDGCDNLREVVLPETLTVLETAAFSNCTSLETINIPENITGFWSSVFSGCTNLKTIQLHDKMEIIGGDAFAKSGLTEIEIPASVNKIESQAFSNCTDLTAVKMNNGPMVIGDSAFEYCTNLTTVMLGEGLDSIGYRAFDNCISLEYITFPSTLNTMGSYMFCECASLKEITFKGFAGDTASDVLRSYESIDADVYYYENIGWEDDIERIVYNAPLLEWIPVEHTHEFDDGKVTQPPTCVETGTFTYTCIECNTKNNETLPKLEHIVESVLPVVPTCTEDGHTAGERCSACGMIFSGMENMPALGHTYGEWQQTEIPTCVTYGVMTRTCEVCGEAEKENLPMIEHVTYTIPGVDATCTTEGREDRVECTLCGNVLQYDNVIPKLPHKHGKWIIEKEATCTEKGLKYRLCECGDKITETIPATGHTEVVIPAEPGDCDSGEKSEGIKCFVCDEWLIEPWISDTPVHNYSSEYIVCLPATMQKEGYKAKCCTKCGAVGEDIIEIPRIKSVKIATPLVYNGKVRNPLLTVTNYYKDTKLKKGVDYTVVYKNALGTKDVKPKNVGKYTAVITFKGEYKGTVKRTFTIKPKATVINKLTKPGKKQIKVTWQKRTVQVTGYQIQYSTIKTFTQKTTKTLKVKNFKSNTKTIKQLKANKKYWVKIRTYKNVNGKIYYSKWSPAKTIKTK